MARVEQLRNAYKVLFLKIERKVPFWKSRHRCEDNIEMCLKMGYKNLY
jgi:TorA maturation chaperone TorD